MKRFKTLETKLVEKNPFWEYYHDKFEGEGGKVGDYYYVQGPNSTFMIPILDDGRLVLVMQYRYLRDKESIEFPGGGLVPNLSPSDNANKELMEETGYQSGEIVKAGEFESLNGIAKEMSHVFIGLDTKKVCDPQAEINGEEQEVVLRRVDEFEEMIKRGEIWDGQTLAAWALAHDRVKKIIEEYGLQSN